jgi:hypothetical protein
MRLGDPAGSVEVRRPAYGDRLIRIDIDNSSPGQGPVAWADLSLDAARALVLKIEALVSEIEAVPPDASGGKFA